MKIQWARWFKLLWVALALDCLQAFLFFWGLEAIGEWSGFVGVSTLSAWMVSNWGPMSLTILTLASLQSLSAILVWHWWDVAARQKEKANGIQ